MRNIIGQVKSAIDIRDIMDNGKILIMNLSKGRIGEDNSALLGAMMITKIQLAAMSRVDVPEKERRDFYLYIDEFQNFSTDSFANILSEARKYRLNLILAHQYIEQLSEKVKPAVFGNVGTMVVFRVGAADAEELVKEFTPTFEEEDLVNLPKYEMYLKLMIDGIASSPFSAKGLPPLTKEEQTGNTEKVVNYSRDKYASEKNEVEEKIMRWHSEEETAASEVAPKINLAGGVNAPVRMANRIETPRTSSSQEARSSQGASTRSTSAANRSQTTSSARPVLNRPTIISSNPVVKSETPKPAPVVQAPPVNRPRIVKDSGYETTCASCGKQTTTAFIPDGVRPVYCKECLSKKKEEKRLELEKRRLAKEIERKHLEEETVLIDTAPPLSLADLAKAAPVDFRGREIKNERPAAKPAAPIENRGAEHELTEGQDMFIANNQY
jgi:CxxC-x17-CxxC domain-containing protein